MICCTKFFGVPCKEVATHWISGGFVSPHPTCQKHVKFWLGQGNEAYLEPVVVAVPLEHTHDGCQ